MVTCFIYYVNISNGNNTMMFNKNVNDNRINERMERKLYNYLKGRNRKKEHIIDERIIANDKVI